MGPRTICARRFHWDWRCLCRPLRQVGRSAAMLEVFDLAKKISRHYTNVLISGPTGCGKELVAHALRQMSPVAQARFAVCNWNGKGWNVTAAKLQRDDPWTGGVLKAEE